jgi:hypothetical protein
MGQMYNPLEHSWWNITVLDPLGQHLLTILYDSEEQTYCPTFDYACPWNACKDFSLPVTVHGQQGDAYAREACGRCKERAEQVAAWLHTAMRMIRRDFAVSADPPPFEVRTQRATKTIQVPGGKGKTTTKEVAYLRPYTNVAYDVSETEMSGESTQGASSGEKQEDRQRQSWFTLHGKDHWIYEWRAQPAITRTYTGAYYRQLIQRCISQLPEGQPGQVEIDGVIYQVDYTAAGEPAVMRTVAFPDGRRVPFLRPEFRKQPLVRQVKAKRFDPKKGTMNERTM